MVTAGIGEWTQSWGSNWVPRSPIAAGAIAAAIPELNFWASASSAEWGVNTVAPSRLSSVQSLTQRLTRTSAWLLRAICSARLTVTSVSVVRVITTLTPCASRSRRRSSPIERVTFFSFKPLKGEIAPGS